MNFRPATNFQPRRYTAEAENFMPVNRKDGANRLSIIWTDKIVLGTALVCAVTLVLILLLIFLVSGSAGADHFLASLGISYLKYIVFTLAGLWGALRAIDYVIGGSTYRLFPKGAPSAAPPMDSLVDDQTVLGLAERDNMQAYPFEATAADFLE